MTTGKLLRCDYTGAYEYHLKHNTDIVCEVCGGPLGGLVYIPETDTFRHRLESWCKK